MDILLQSLLILLFAPLLTCIIELPIIRAFKITRSNIYIIAVNVMTNLILNTVSVVFGMYFQKARLPWVIICEALLIPVGESELYNVISDAGRKKVYIATYIANAVSFLIGLAITTALGL